MTAYVTQHIDFALIALYAFWLFFFALLFYLRREDRREGYPLESEVTGQLRQDTAIWMPKPKVWSLPGGGTAQAPTAINEPPLNAKRMSKLDGIPYEPTGDPITGAFGPAAYALRKDEPDYNGYGHKKIVPISSVPDYDVIKGDTDPRGFPVVSGDGQKVGELSDLWIDTSESVIRYYEVTLDAVTSPADGDGEAGATVPRRILVPFAMATVRNPGVISSVVSGLTGERTGNQVTVRAVTADQMANAPTTKAPDTVTRLEEDKISAFYAGAEFFNHRATPPGSMH